MATEISERAPGLGTTEASFTFVISSDSSFVNLIGFPRLYANPGLLQGGRNSPEALGYRQCMPKVYLSFTSAAVIRRLNSGRFLRVCTGIVTLKKRMHVHLVNIWLECISN